MTRSRSLRRVASLAALVAWLVGGVGPAFASHARDGFDTECGEQAWSSPHPTTQIEGVVPAVHDGHCGACHLQRATRHAVRATVALLVDITAQHVTTHSTPRPSITECQCLPSRAPPSLS